MQTPEEYEVTERVATLMKSLKKQRGYTKKDISRLLGVGLTTLDDYLNGVSSFRLGTLLKFAQLCKVSLSDILEDSENLTKLYEKKVNKNETRTSAQIETKED
ncbi:helix-turn-helix transcriptional regulator [Pseudoalteromonas xiamenensis]|uniref:helix-turn-helix domain-containing protein n=1 Tax=Pseudoalteromonas xiamenensis TaxID=882626 RepID=UPI0027E3EE39|nr:helix-turn-helix transcriptional regulator [Pseudoalteromonas xiamenensis]WMN61363.1 helix-turn-helix transcriptional regulator [Pseudoalteromonas xiamenensis]